MTEILSMVDPEKKDRILNSAFEEFGRSGFEKASTNEIVEKAGISKGLLFHYFGSKQALYETLQEFAVGYVMEILEKGIDWTQSDLFLRVQQITRLKLTAMEKYPHIYDFLKGTMENLPAEKIKDQFSDRMLTLIRRAYQENIDFSLFRPDVEISKAIEMIQWTVEGAAIKLMKSKNGDMIQITEAFGTYMELLRTLLYTQERTQDHD